MGLCGNLLGHHCDARQGRGQEHARDPGVSRSCGFDRAMDSSLSDAIC
jgi:hypothetical protein